MQPSPRPEILFLKFPRPYCKFRPSRPISRLRFLRVNASIFDAIRAPAAKNTGCQDSHSKPQSHHGGDIQNLLGGGSTRPPSGSQHGFKHLLGDNSAPDASSDGFRLHSNWMRSNSRFSPLNTGRMCSFTDGGERLRRYPLAPAITPATWPCGSVAS